MAHLLGSLAPSRLAYPLLPSSRRHGKKIDSVTWSFRGFPPTSLPAPAFLSALTICSWENLDILRRLLLPRPLRECSGQPARSLRTIGPLDHEPSGGSEVSSTLFDRAEKERDEDDDCGGHGDDVAGACRANLSRWNQGRDHCPVEILVTSGSSRSLQPQPPARTETLLSNLSSAR